MNISKFLTIILIGALFGYGAYYMKAEAESSSEIIDNMDKGLFEACKEHNEFGIKYDAGWEQRDCEKEFLD